MPIIRSGTTTERIVRAGILTLFISGYSAWSLWDGYIAYPRANVRAVFEERAGLSPPVPLPVVNDELTPKAAELVGQAKSLDELQKQIGPPAVVSGEEAYFLGNGGFLQVRSRNGRVEQADWHDGPKQSPTDLFFQKLIGFLLAPIGLLLIARWIRIVTARTVLTEHELSVPGHAAIPLSAISGVVAGDNADTAIIQYSKNGVTREVELDSYLVKQQRAIVAALCKTRGLSSPYGSSLSDE